ncbi:unnamed protein product [Notodromas monacha]|uniref:Transporter n=1 Tax=Notodromas monacha TaxID=399045 RepID=A0A7R9BUZ0_9CRUS|nr:unnamed protein product [Notodromas monacha]CAG0921260.1 unnamed protein product [Notodromas monacha]
MTTSPKKAPQLLQVPSPRTRCDTELTEVGGTSSASLSTMISHQQQQQHPDPKTTTTTTTTTSTTPGGNWELDRKNSSSSSSSGSAVLDEDVEGVVVTSGGKDDGRSAFANHAEFLAGMISMAVGLGNVWRFPYLCQRNGGGAFLIPYVILLVVEGMPLSLIEIGLGQRFGRGSIGVWKGIHPGLGGLGVASTAVSFLVGLYYNVVITWCLYYLFRSFTTQLPWAECPVVNETRVEECAKSSETQYFWYREALNSSESIGDFEGINWHMFVCLLLAWLIVFLTMRKGIQSSGKVLYITAVFPYVVLAIFFIRAVTLRGAASGLLHLLTPKVRTSLN